MKKLFARIFILTLSLFSFWGYSQVHKDTIYVASGGIDAQVNGALTSNNYGNDSLMSVLWMSGKPFRSFVDFDLSSIPTNAVIINADLKLYATTVNNGATHDINIDRVMASWAENSIKFSLQPDITTTGRVLISHASTSSVGWQTLRVTDLARYAINYPSINHGWRLSLKTESGGTNNGVIYATSEYPTTSKRPYIIVEYVLPIQLNATVMHCTNGMNNGAIDMTVADGSGTYTGYTWYKYTNGTVTTVQSGSSVSNIDIDSLADGLYLCTVTDNKSTMSYKYFLVGEYGATTTVEFRNASSTANSVAFNEDAQLSFTITGSDGTRTGSSETTMYALKNSTTYNSSLFKFQVDFDSLFDISKAELRLISGGHYRNSSPATTDSGYVSRVTAHWNEYNVNWDIKPSTTTTNRQTINQTSPAGAVTRNDTINILPFVEHWQANPTENYGIDLSLKKYSQASDAYLRYYSTDNSTSSNRPGFVVTYSLPQQIVTTYIDSIDAGHITVTAPSGELPYTYLISRDTLVSMQDLWDEIKDSTRVDSAYFFGGKSNTQTYRFENLPSDRYYIGVYDNNGDQLLMKEVFLTPDFELAYNSADFEYVNGIFQVKAANTDAEATLLTRLPEGEDGGIGFQVNQLTNIVRFGFTTVDAARPSSTAGYNYSVEIKTTGKVYLSRADTLIDSTTVIVGDRLILSSEDGTVYLYKNYAEVGSDIIKQWNKGDWKVDLELKGTAGKIKPEILYGKLKLPRPKVTVHYPDCGQTNAYVVLSVPSSTFYGITNLNFQLRDQSNTLLYSGSTLPPMMVLDVGIYTLYYTYTIPGVAGVFSYYYDQIAVGYPVQWTWDPDTDNITPLLASLNSIKPTVIITQAEADGENECKDDPSVLNWLQFESRAYHKLVYQDPLLKPWNYEEIQLRNDGTLYAKVRIEEIAAGMVARYVFLYNGVTPDSYYLTTSVMPFSIEFPTDGSGNYDKVELYQDGSLKGDFDTNVDGIMTVSAKEKGDVIIENTIVSFCGENKIQSYADVTRKLDGGFYLAKKGIVRFIYEEEYRDLNGQLTYTIYDETNQVVISSGMVPQPVAYGDNRYILDFSCMGSYTLSDGIYILEVVNEKNEKWYLRFKVVDNC